MLPRFLYILILSFIVSSLGLVSCKNAKPDSPQPVIPGNRKSPIAISSIKHDGTYIKIVYGQPYRKGRTIFGEWEPYGEVWRTGANEATEITITKTVLIQNQSVPAGTYSLFTIPNREYWTIILNNSLGQWGAFEYSPQTDLMRFKVPVIHLDEPIEAFTISFSEVQTNITTLSMEWDTVRVEFPIRFL